MSLAPEMRAVFAPLQRLFTAPTWRNVQGLLVGPLLARGRRPVTAARRQMGVGEAPACRRSHHASNRARWSALDGSRRLVSLLVQTFVAVGGPRTFVLDEPLERRWGRCIRKRGHSREPLASSRQRSVATSGVRWMVWTRVIPPPWTSRAWALPVVSVPAPPPERSQRLGLRHNTLAQRARQRLLVGRRWLPAGERTIIGDQSSRVLAWGTACTRHPVRLRAPVRRDTALYEPAPLRAPGTNGRPRVTGERVPTLAQLLSATTPTWQRLRVRGDNGRWRVLALTSGTAVWSRIGHPGLPCAGCSSAVPTGNMSHVRPSRPVRLSRRATSSSPASNAGRSRPPVKKDAPRWAVQPKGRGQPRSWSARHRACWDGMRSSPCWRMRGIPMASCRSERLLGTPRRKRPLRMPWHTYGAGEGRRVVFRHLRTPRTS